MRWAVSLLAAIWIGSAAAENPNVLLVVADDISYTDFGVGNNRMPAVQRLARSGTEFRCVLTSPMCRASLASIVSGQHVTEHLIYQNNAAGTLDSAGSLVEAMNRAGYVTRREGKFWEGSFGFSEQGPTPRPSGDAGFVRNGQAEAIDFVMANSELGQPWFLWYAPQLPHTPHDAGADYESRVEGNHLSAERAFLANQIRLDDAIGDILDAVADTGTLSNTLVVFVSDNGWSIGQESKGAPVAMGWLSPLVFRHPSIEPGKVPHVASSRDIAPTILGFCGIDKPPQMTGRDLLNDSITGPQFGASFADWAPGDYRQRATGIYALGPDGVSYRKRLAKVPDNYHPPGVSVSYPIGQERSFWLDNDPFEQFPIDLKYADETWQWWTGEPVDPPEPDDYEKTVDNGDQEYSEIGQWRDNVNPNNGNGGDLRFSNIPGAMAAYRFDDVPQGAVTVRISYVANPNRSASVPVIVSDSTGIVLQSTVDQRGPKGTLRWATVGTTEVIPPVVVTLGVASDGYTIADAVRVGQ